MIKETSECTIHVCRKIENATNLQKWCHMSFGTSCFSMDHYFLSVFTSHNSNLMFLTWGKVMVLVSMVFQRLLNSLNAILTTVLQQKSQKRISRSSACLFTFYRRKYFFAYSWQLNVFYFHFKSAEWPGNFDVMFEILVARGWIVCRHLWQPGAH